MKAQVFQCTLLYSTNMIECSSQDPAGTLSKNSLPYKAQQEESGKEDAFIERFLFLFPNGDFFMQDGDEKLECCNWRKARGQPEGGVVL